MQEWRRGESPAKCRCILGGGRGYPVWAFGAKELGPAFVFRQTNASHGVIDPAYRLNAATLYDEVELYRRTAR